MIPEPQFAHPWSTLFNPCYLLQIIKLIFNVHSQEVFGAILFQIQCIRANRLNVLSQCKCTRGLARRAANQRTAGQVCENLYEK